MAVESVSRREALRQFLFGAGALVSAPLWVQDLCRTALAASGSDFPVLRSSGDAEWKPLFLKSRQCHTVDLICELIIPETDTPGAGEAQVYRFIDAVLSESDEHHQQQFLKGLEWMDRRSRQLFGKAFADTSPQQQTALLTVISSPSNQTLENQLGVEFFSAVKALTITGYYTSDIGIFEELKGGQLHFDDYPGCTHPEHQGK